MRDVQAQREAHELAGKTVALKGGALGGELEGQQYVVEDWWINVHGTPWGEADGNPAAMKYAVRAGFGGLPSDDEVVYGKIHGMGHLVHVSELGEEVTEPAGVA